MEFLTFGYYIVAPVLKPDYIGLNCASILSASECICDFHPSLDGSLWLNHQQEQKAYQETLGLTDEKFDEMKALVCTLHVEHRLDNDSRFLALSDAVSFYQTYLCRLKDLRIIELALEVRDQPLILEETEGDTNVAVPLTAIQPGGTLLGYELLGWDYCSFHSYLCNGLDKHIAEKFPLQVNEVGLMQHSYSQVKAFAKHIEHKGEPVCWVPFALYEHAVVG